ncbi:SPOR domain-containing protein [Yoonia litorea]|uniref:Sporulation related domain-containing protein n=1 Tax=Yoonia litorea TaxID=1123755 RepID=A0A1I6LQY7_9RHOB|nr:SPOR domain-containing protein [Yoonia litorea]SFS05905.1 Sporulation related domain-containing protein [Yoonia litorea]
MSNSTLKISHAWRAAFLVAGLGALAACDENGQFALGAQQGAEATSAPLPANAPGQRTLEERDVERPDLFEVSARALWDGRPSLGGVWVAHPDVDAPERVLIRNTENGEVIIGALFRRERLNPGPVLQVSSDAAEALGILAGAPTDLYVVALRREEVQILTEATEDNPVLASLEAPVNVEAAPLAPAPVAEASVEAADVVVDTAASAVEAAPVVVQESAETVTETAAATFAAAASLAAAADAPATEPEDTVDVSAVFAAPIAPADGPMAQIGVFSNERNANAAADQIRQSGIAAEVLAENMGGQTVWRLVAGPMASAAALTTIQNLGYVDAFIIEDDTE